MDPHHRKIDLTSPLDLGYLEEGIERAAQAKIDLHFPPDAAAAAATTSTSDDQFRNQVQALVHQYVHATLAATRPSISINGLDCAPSTKSGGSSSSRRGAAAGDEADAEADDSIAYEPYDPTLALRLRELYTELESATTAVAELRRDAPAKAAELYLSQLKAEVAARAGESSERRRREKKRMVVGGRDGRAGHLDSARKGGTTPTNEAATSAAAAAAAVGGETEMEADDANRESSSLVAANQEPADMTTTTNTTNPTTITTTTGLESVDIPRHEAIADAWTGAQRDLDKLRAVTEAVAVLERARAAAGEVGVVSP